MNNNIPKYFITASLFFMILGAVEGMMFPSKFQFMSFYSAVFGLPPEYIKPFFGTFVKKIHTHINLIGWVGSSIMGILYYITPLMNRGGYQHNPKLGWLNFLCHVSGLVLFTLGFHMVGVTGLSSGETPGSEAFRAVVAPCKVFTTTGGILITLSTLIFTYNTVRTLFGKGERKDEL